MALNDTVDFMPVLASWGHLLARLAHRQAVDAGHADRDQADLEVHARCSVS
jgi:hypothetical protein